MKTKDISINNSHSGWLCKVTCSIKYCFHIMNTTQWTPPSLNFFKLYIRNVISILRGFNSQFYWNIIRQSTSSSMKRVWYEWKNEFSKKKHVFSTDYTFTNICLSHFILSSLGLACLFLGLETMRFKTAFVIKHCWRLRFHFPLQTVFKLGERIKLEWNNQFIINIWSQMIMSSIQSMI